MKTFLKLPEYLLILAVLFYWFSAGTVLNPVAIALFFVMVLQIVYKNRVLGSAIGSILILASFYMILALISEVKEFPTFNAEAQKLLLTGMTFFVSSMMLSSLMLYKYLAIPREKL